VQLEAQSQIGSDGSQQPDPSSASNVSQRPFFSFQINDKNKVAQVKSSKTA